MDYRKKSVPKELGDINATAEWYNYSNEIIRDIPMAANEQRRRLELVASIRQYIKGVLQTYCGCDTMCFMQLDYFKGLECIRLEVPDYYLLKRINIDCDSNVAVVIDFEKQFGARKLIEHVTNAYAHQGEYREEQKKEREYYEAQG